MPIDQYQNVRNGLLPNVSCQNIADSIGEINKLFAGKELVAKSKWCYGPVLPGGSFWRPRDGDRIHCPEVPGLYLYWELLIKLNKSGCRCERNLRRWRYFYAFRVCRNGSPLVLRARSAYCAERRALV